MSRIRVLAVVLILVGSARLSAQGPGASTHPAADDALSPAVREALVELSSDDYKIRQGALAKLELALGQQMRLLVTSDDPEVQSRLTTLLQFNDGLTRWVLDTMKLPDDQRKAQLEFGLQPELLPIIGQIFSPDADRRLQGVRALANQPSEQATAMLARLLEDPDRAVYVAAMEAVWDRKPTDAVVDALWTRAVESGFRGYRQPQRVLPQEVKFRGKVIGVGGVTITGAYGWGQDATIAADVLVHLKPPQVQEKLKTFMVSLEKMATSNPWLLNTNTEQMKNLQRLLEIYKPREALAVLYRIARAPVVQRMPGVMNNEKYFWSNRTAALAWLIVQTEQKPEDYHLKRMAPMGGMWTLPSEDDENNALKKLGEWVTQNGQKFGLGDDAAATQPESPRPASVRTP